MIGENRPMTFSYHIDYKLGSTVKTATGSNEDRKKCPPSSCGLEKI